MPELAKRNKNLTSCPGRRFAGEDLERKSLYTLHLHKIRTHFGEDGVLGPERPDVYGGGHLQRRTLGDLVELSPR